MPKTYQLPVPPSISTLVSRDNGRDMIHLSNGGLVFLIAEVLYYTLDRSNVVTIGAIRGAGYGASLSRDASDNIFVFGGSGANGTLRVQAWRRSAPNYTWTEAGHSDLFVSAISSSIPIAGTASTWVNTGYPAGRLLALVGAQSRFGYVQTGDLGPLIAAASGASVSSVITVYTTSAAIGSGSVGDMIDLVPDGFGGETAMARVPVDSSTWATYFRPITLSGTGNMVIGGTFTPPGARTSTPPSFLFVRVSPGKWIAAYGNTDTSLKYYNAVLLTSTSIGSPVASPDLKTTIGPTSSAGASMLSDTKIPGRAILIGCGGSTNSGNSLDIHAVNIDVSGSTVVWGSPFKTDSVVTPSNANGGNTGRIVAVREPIGTKYDWSYLSMQAASNPDTYQMIGNYTDRNTAPNSPTWLLPEDGSALSTRLVNRFSWESSDPDSGDSQTGFDLKYRDSDSAVSYSGAVLADSPIGYWRLGETSGSNAIDSSGNGRQGNLMNGIGSSTSGFVRGVPGAIVNDSDTAITFNNASQTWIDLGNPAAFQLTTGSVEFWFKSTQTGQYRGLVIKQWAYGVFLFDGKLRVYDWSLTAAAFDSTTLYNDGNWHHVVLSFSQGTASGSSLYVDGVKIGTFTLNFANQNENLVIAAGEDSAAAPTQYLTGTIDDVSLYDSVLSESQVQVHYGAGQGGAPWIIVSGTTSDEFWDAPAGTFTAGNKEAQVRVYDQSAAVSPYSSSLFFTAFSGPHVRGVIQGGIEVAAHIRGVIIGGVEVAAHVKAVTTAP